MLDAVYDHPALAAFCGLALTIVISLGVLIMAMVASGMAKRSRGDYSPLD